MSALRKLFDDFQTYSQSVRDKGTAFEQLMIRYFGHEPFYRDLYRQILPYAQWVEVYRDTLPLGTMQDAGIDLVATTFTGEHHAIQCKHFGMNHRISKKDIDSFFTASGKRYFSHRLIVTSTDKWTQHATDALDNQQPPVSVINLTDLEKSLIDWAQYRTANDVVFKARKQLMPHQQTALQQVSKGLAEAERGKLIMACGTGKTFTGLKIAEALAGKGKRVLFLVPSLALLSQTLTEWTQESDTPLHNFAVCSDSDVGKRKGGDDDRVAVTISDLQYPATTNDKSLYQVMTALHDDKHMSVVYATYHSIDVIHRAQQRGLPAFDLIICDEAHRTTGATFDGEKESAFVRVHDNQYLQVHKRLYMTATPRIYGEAARQTEGVTLCSMDDEALYGKNLYVITFSDAVSRGLLVDYKVIVLAVEEGHISRQLQDLLKDEQNQLKVADAAKIIGCWKALAKYGITGAEADRQPMQRAVAFCQVIEKSYKGKKHKVSSKLIADMFGEVVEAYRNVEIKRLWADNPDAELPVELKLSCEAEHVDGSMNAGEKENRLQWLKAADGMPDNTCRILSNVRCLSEGVDVPSLDAVLFLTPRNSQVDVVQSVGRVMRRAAGKKQGYVILPVVVPAGVEANEALDKNENYRVVWQVLNALRAHDDRFDAMINKLEFNGKDSKKMEVIAVADQVQRKAPQPGKKARTVREAQANYVIGSSEEKPVQGELQFEIGEIERALYATIVKKCGNRHHWEDWAGDIAKIANTHIDRIHAILENADNYEEIAAFQAFAAELRDDLNSAISDDEIIEMLAQHLITKPVFDALFAEYRFTRHNPISVAMQKVLDKLQEHALDKERNTLQSFYESVQMRAGGIATAEGKQKIVVELYDKFFRNAFPRMTKRLGIVYTPVEVVDFIIRSVEDVMQQEFNASLADEGVQILEPFLGTGTFITRLMQSGIIPADKLAHKYRHEIHANEIVLLAYYIACINIETTYHGIMTGTLKEEGKADMPYIPFEGICFTDTFQMYEREDMVDKLLVENSARRKRQKAQDIQVIIGNPPYSAGQESANDNNQNYRYPDLDRRIEQTYAAHSSATLKNSLYDSYIRAIRWASDRISDKQGVIGFVTNAGWIEGNTADGLRQCLAEEFSSLYIFHLRGNARTSGERRRKEKDNIFGQGTRTPIAISILVKNPAANTRGNIYFHDIGDYLSREQKLETIAALGSIAGISEKHGWQSIVPDAFHDWLNQRDPNFDRYMVLGDKKDKTVPTIFENYSNGIKTNRDAWCYNFSAQALATTMEKMIAYYNSEVDRYTQLSSTKKVIAIEEFLEYDSSKFSWDRAQKRDLPRGKYYQFDEENIVKGMYRPFTSEWMYFSRQVNNCVYQIPQLFPNIQATNRVFSVTGRGSSKAFSVLMTDAIPDLEMVSKGQCFPLELYEYDDVNGTERNGTERNGTERNGTERNGTERNYYQKPVQKATNSRSIENLVICLTVTGNKGFSVLMTDCIPDLHLIGDAQCFPMFLYETEEEAS